MNAKNGRHETKRSTFMYRRGAVALGALATLGLGYSFIGDSDVPLNSETITVQPGESTLWQVAQHHPEVGGDSAQVGVERLMDATGGSLDVVPGQEITVVPLSAPPEVEQTRADGQ